MSTADSERYLRSLSLGDIDAVSPYIQDALRRGAVTDVLDTFLGLSPDDAMRDAFLEALLFARQTAPGAFSGAIAAKATAWPIAEREDALVLLLGLCAEASDWDAVATALSEEIPEDVIIEPADDSPSPPTRA